jgi:dihydroorotate dehydrogenase
VNSSPTEALPRYDRTRSYAWNYENAPESADVDVPPISGKWTFCGLPVDSPLGMPAGPLLNGKWILYYASLGFDVLTYKTARSVARECFPLPNLQPVAVGQLTGGEVHVPAIAEMAGSWAVSFGMPSTTPDVWRADIEKTRDQLPKGKLLSVSVVGTVQDGWTIDDLAADYVNCARWAVDSGADCIETNFSCPNVATCDGQLFQQPDDAATVTEAVRKAIGSTPYIVKVGHLTDAGEVATLLGKIGAYVDSLAMTNSVAAQVLTSDDELLFDGQPRGICGDATRLASIGQTRLFAETIRALKLDAQLIGVGGVSTAAHVRDYLAAGAESVHIATAAMVDPLIACRIRSELFGD